MKYFAWLGPFLLAGALSAGPPPYVMATAAGYIPGATPTALQQHLVQPVVVAYDPDGNLYYGTTHQVWRLNPDGSATVVAGDGAPGTSGTLGWVSGLAIDTRQNVYIADLLSYEIHKVSPGGTMTRFAGTGAAPAYGTQSNASAANAALKVALTPGSLAMDATSLYVTDSATSSVLAFSLDGKTSRVVAGNHGSQSSGDGGPAAGSSLFYPGTLALANGALYINEANGARIRQVTFRSGVISTLVKLVQSYLTDNGNPGLAADSDGTVYVQNGNAINRLAPARNPAAWAGQPTLLSPKSLAVDPTSHDLALASFTGNVIQVISFNTGDIQTVAGLVHFAGDGGPAAMAIFNGLEGVVVDAQGNVYVADTGNNRIRKIDTRGIVTTIAGTGVAGFSGDHGPATVATLNMGHGAQFASNLAIDGLGNLYVSDYSNGRIRKIDTSGIITTVAGGGNAPMVRGSYATSSSLQPGPLAVDSAGNIYFGNVFILASALMPTVYKIDPTGLVAPYAGGAGNSSDSGPALTTPIGYAYCLMVGPHDDLYVGDSKYNRVWKISTSGMMTTVASAIGPPTALAMDAQGDLFFYSTKQVTKIDATGTLQSVAGTNTAPVTSGGDGGSASQATFISVGGMAFDPSGKLYLSDGGTYLREAIPVGSNGPPPIISSGGIIGAGASVPPVQSVSPGAIVSIFGTNFYPTGAQHLLTAEDLLSGSLPTVLGGVCVSFGGVNAPITGVFPGQINVQVPVLSPGPVTVTVTNDCGGTNPVAGNVSAVAVDTASPEFFSTGHIIAANVSSGVVEAYGTGWGATSPAIAPGVVPGMAAPLTSTVELMLGGVPVPADNILYAGISPCCAGLYQLDFTVPDGTPAGNLPLVITIDGISSPGNAYVKLP